MLFSLLSLTTPSFIVPTLLEQTGGKWRELTARRGAGTTLAFQAYALRKM